MIESFLASVYKVYTSITDDKNIDSKNELVPKYNGNESFTDKDVRFLGAIEFRTEKYVYSDDNIAFPFDKNNLTFPIEGETITIIKIDNIYYWLPYSNTQYPNFREDVGISEIAREKTIRNINTAGNTSQGNQSKNLKYKINEKIKFLEPKTGDTIISGRVGNTIRFSEFHLTEDGKTSSPGIFIRNKQNPELDNEPIGTLISEDINKDGTSVYFTSGKIKVPFKETIKKQKIAFANYPNSTNLTGDQLFVNSDRIILSAKAKEFIIFGKGNTGIITDGRFSVDSQNEIYLHSEKNITIHSKDANNIFLNSENGNVYLGKKDGVGDAGASVQKMVLGGELVQIMGDLIDAILQQQYLTPAGPSKPGPENAAQFNSIKSKLKTLLSAKNYLSKN